MSVCTSYIRWRSRIYEGSGGSVTRLCSLHYATQYRHVKFSKFQNLKEMTQIEIKYRLPVATSVLEQHRSAFFVSKIYYKSLDKDSIREKQMAVRNCSVRGNIPDRRLGGRSSRPNERNVKVAGITARLRNPRKRIGLRNSAIFFEDLPKIYSRE